MHLLCLLAVQVHNALFTRSAVDGAHVLLREHRILFLLLALLQLSHQLVKPLQLQQISRTKTYHLFQLRHLFPQAWVVAALAALVSQQLIDKVSQLLLQISKVLFADLVV